MRWDLNNLFRSTVRTKLTKHHSHAADGRIIRAVNAKDDYSVLLMMIAHCPYKGGLFSMRRMRAWSLDGKSDAFPLSLMDFGWNRTPSLPKIPICYWRYANTKEKYYRIVRETQVPVASVGRVVMRVMVDTCSSNCGDKKGEMRKKDTQSALVIFYYFVENAGIPIA